MTTTLTLADFLLARYDEEEAGARAADRPEPGFPEQSWLAPWDSDTEGIERPAWDHLNHWSPARVLAECEAKRRIVGEHAEFTWNSGAGEGSGDCSTCGDVPQVEFPCDTLRFLALPYADHPDYQQEWRP